MSIRTGPVNSVPPWTIRWPTASTLPKLRTASANSDSTDPSAGGGRSDDPTTRSPGSRTLSFRVLEPALTTRMSISNPASVRPGPAADFWHILALLPGILASPEQFVLNRLSDVGRV